MVEDITKDKLNKKRVLKNTIMLYIRMLALMVIGFITTRVVLAALGEVDYGLNNAIAGFVALTYVLTGSLNAAESRFITFELGKGNQKKLNSVFSTAVIVQLVMATVVALLIESIGMWFLENHMTIPAERLIASRWVLHFAAINTFVNLLFVPYSAAIISHEKMDVYAYVSIIEGVLNLGIAYLISIDLWTDRLVFYSGALCLSAFTIHLIYFLYCLSKFEECKFRTIFDKELFRNLGQFAGWNLFGAVSSVLRDQGINVLFNVFCGPAVNAARGVSNQASGIATKFAGSFMQAINPQITKSYASGNYEYMNSLVSQGTRIAFALFFIIALPIFIETDFLIGLWLINVPAHTVAFIRILLVLLFFDSIQANPLITVMLATGNIKYYQIIVGGLQLLEFPVALVMLYLGASPEMVLIMVASIACSCMVARLYMLHRYINYPVIDYLKGVTFRLLSVIVVSSIIPALIKFLSPNTNLWNLLVIFVSLISAGISMWLIDFTRGERKQMIKRVLARIPFAK